MFESAWFVLLIQVLLAVFDSSTKFPESMLMGQTVFLGNFDECIGVEVVETNSGSFKGQHCLVALEGKPTQSWAHELYDVPDIGGFREYKHGVARKDRMVGTLVFCINRCVKSAPILQNRFIIENKSANFMIYSFIFNNLQHSDCCLLCSL
jgi:hypothetical protein